MMKFLLRQLKKMQINVLQMKIFKIYSYLTREVQLIKQMIKQQRLKKIKFLAQNKLILKQKYRLLELMVSFILKITSQEFNLFISKNQDQLKKYQIILNLFKNFQKIFSMIKNFQNSRVYQKDKAEVIFRIQELKMIRYLTTDKDYLTKNTSQKLIMILKKEYLQDGLIGLQNRKLVVDAFGNILLNFLKIFKQF